MPYRFIPSLMFLAVALTVRAVLNEILNRGRHHRKRWQSGVSEVHVFVAAMFVVF